MLAIDEIKEYWKRTYLKVNHLAVTLLLAPPKRFQLVAGGYQGVHKNNQVERKSLNKITDGKHCWLKEPT